MAVGFEFDLDGSEEGASEPTAINQMRVISPAFADYSEAGAAEKRQLIPVIMDIFMEGNEVIGIAGTHVDDFQIGGDDRDPRWKKRQRKMGRAQLQPVAKRPTRKRSLVRRPGLLS